MVFIAANLIVLGAFLLRSLSGFGGALISVPLLSIFYSVKFVVPVECLFEVVLSVILLPKVYHSVDRQELLRLLGGAILGSVLGSYFLVNFADQLLKMILGVVILVVALALFKGVSSWRMPSWGGYLAGLVGGVLGGMFGTSGPAYVAYLAIRLPEPHKFRATLIALFAIEYTWRLFVYIYQGLLPQEGFTFALQLMPALVIGTLVGHMLHAKFAEKSFHSLVAALLLVSGILCFV